MKDGHQPTLLIIEDDPSLRDSLHRTLRGKNYIILAAEEGGEGMKLMQKHAVDIVLIDMFMPGKEGVETIRELRRSYPHVKVIAMSGGGTKGEVDVLQVAKVMGCRHTLVKPFSGEDLIKAIEAQLA
jgi:DNA-binding response OmpR family regulator